MSEIHKIDPKFGKNVKGGNESIFGENSPNKQGKSGGSYDFGQSRKSTDRRMEDINRQHQAREMKRKALESQIKASGASVLGKGGPLMSNEYHDSGFSHSGGGSFFGGGSIILKVEPTILKNKATEVERYTKTLETEFESIQDIVAKTTGYWIGIAGDKARQDFASQKDDTATIIKRFMEHPIDLMAMAGVYEETERQITERNQSLETDVIV